MSQELSLAVASLSGFCECGCGERTPLAKVNHAARGLVKGRPLRFIHGHNARVWTDDSKAKMADAARRRKREKNNNWRGGVRQLKTGYRRVYQPDSPMADQRGCVLEHRFVMAQAIGRDLLPKEVVHHINGCKDDNRIENLQLFASQGDHQRHHREREAAA